MTMKKESLIVAVLLVCLVFSHHLDCVAAQGVNCYDSCNTACVAYRDERLYARCDRKCQIKCGPAGASTEEEPSG